MIQKKTRLPFLASWAEQFFYWLSFLPHAQLCLATSSPN
jgi:hypothetical protein